jgi:hypothetical protein
VDCKSCPKNMEGQSHIFIGLLFRRRWWEDNSVKFHISSANHREPMGTTTMEHRSITCWLIAGQVWIWCHKYALLMRNRSRLLWRSIELRPYFDQDSCFYGVSYWEQKQMPRHSLLPRYKIVWGDSQGSGHVRCTTDTPPDRVLREIAQWPKKGYNAPDISGLTPIKALDAHTQTVYKV